MFNRKGIGVPGAIVLAVFLSVGVIVGTLAVTGNLGGTSGSIVSTGSRQTTIKTTTAGTCDPQATNPPELAYVVKNSLNNTGKEYMSADSIVFSDPSMSSDSFVVSNTTVTTGLPGIGKGLQVNCPGDKGYTVAILASSTVNSGKHTFAASELNDNRATWTFALPQHTDNVVAKVYDNDARAGVKSGSDNSTGYQVNGSSFWSTTDGNVTEAPIGTDGEFDYTMTVKINTTASGTDAQFTDSGLIIAIDAQNTAEWNEPTTLTVENGVVKKVDCPTKISNDGFDWCYAVTLADGKPYPIDSTARDIHIAGKAKSGVNPSDDWVIGLYTSGLYQHILDNGVSDGYTNDASSPAYIHSPIQFTLRFA